MEKKSNAATTVSKPVKVSQEYLENFFKDCKDLHLKILGKK